MNHIKKINFFLIKNRFIVLVDITISGHMSVIVRANRGHFRLDSVTCDSERKLSLVGVLNAFFYSERRYFSLANLGPNSSESVAIAARRVLCWMTTMKVSG